MWKLSPYVKVKKSGLIYDVSFAGSTIWQSLPLSDSILSRTVPQTNLQDQHQRTTDMLHIYTV